LEESTKLIHSILSDVETNEEGLSQLIHRISKGNPEKITRNCEEVNNAIKNNDLNPKDSKSINVFISKLEPADDRVVIFSKSNFLSFAFLLLAMRYFFYSKKWYDYGYTSALIAYFIFFLMRRKKK